MPDSVKQSTSVKSNLDAEAAWEHLIADRGFFPGAWITTNGTKGHERIKIAL